MTVTYSDTSFIRLLFRWRGSIWKSVWKELLVFLFLYFTINFCFRFAMPVEMQSEFKGVVHFVGKWIRFIPLQFLLGFFVQYIVGRWWDQLMSIGWPDKFLLFLTANLPGNDHHTRMTRRTIARWILLHACLVWKEISVKIKKRFPTDAHLLKAGLFTKSEYELFGKTTSTQGRWFVPISWIVNLMVKRNQEKIISDIGLNQLVSELYAFRSANGMLTLYDWINAPLRYTQVTTFATYGYFAMCLIGRQVVPHKFAEGDIYVDLFFPVATVLEFIFYVGWLKVAEEYRVPFGEDDDDFDMNYILDRNVHVANMLVDELAAQNPDPCEDIFFNDRYPTLPHTKASAKCMDQVPNWRLCKFRVPDNASEYLERKMREHNVDIPDHATPLLDSRAKTVQVIQLPKDAVTQDDIHLSTTRTGEDDATPLVSAHDTMRMHSLEAEDIGNNSKKV